MARLRIFHGRRLVEERSLTAPVTVIGRAEDVDVPLPDPSISRRHVRIKNEGGAFIAEDMGTKNGVFINGQFAPFKILEDGDKIELSSFTLVFQAKDPAVQEEPEPISAFAISKDALSALNDETDEITLTQAPEVPSGMEKAATMIMSPEALMKKLQAQKIKLGAHVAYNDDGRRVEIPLRDGPVLIGWSDECQVKLPGRKLLGRLAAVVEPDGEGGHVVQAKSNMTSVKVHGEKVTRHVLRDEEAFDVGNIRLRYYRPADT